MGLFEEIEKRSNVYTHKPLSLYDWDEVIKKMDNPGKQRSQVIYGSRDTVGYIGAVYNEDEDAIREYEIKFTKQAFQQLKSEHKKMQSCGVIIYGKFCELESKYKRRGWTWFLPGDYEYGYMTGSVEIVFRDGEFHKELYVSDEYGWESKRIKLEV